MTLIKSISGIRGTVGGKVGDNLTPLDTVKFVAAYTSFLKAGINKENIKIVLGRDARLSGEMYARLVSATLVSMGCDVIDIGLATTPTTELAVIAEHADGGIILTASHNPKQWNALKLLNSKGEFLSAADGEQVLELAEEENFDFVEVDNLGEITEKDYTDYHIENVLGLQLVDAAIIEKAGLKIVVDAVNSVGGVVIPRLLAALGVKDITCINCEPDGNFKHNPEPLAEHLTEISAKVRECGADMGIVVDPDVDRLAFISENGEMFGEEYTLVAVADYVLSNKVGNTVSNLSSSRALRDVTLSHGGNYGASAVGEVNVVEEMKRIGAIIGGEGNGGVIYPASHYGRDALVGIGLFLTHYVKENKKMTDLKASYPAYFISKNKIQLSASTDVDGILEKLKEVYRNEKVTDIDGVKIDFKDGWVHLRKSNTEPIIRVYSEAKDETTAKSLADNIIYKVKEWTN
ncbi:MAG: phosphoglucosamine mutase [Culturomica sp.]|jgi:phosphomannomutase|nr:phosphoglucosamine mutase [Culturomica sp.]